MPITRRAVLGAAAASAFVPVLGRGGDVDDLIRLRRDLHSHPELSGQEAYTAGVVARRLRAAGLEVTAGIGGHGVVGVLRGAGRGRTVAYRADMDAVPAQGQIPAGASAAHVCGHDIHTTVGVGVAEALARQRRRLAGTVVFVFQPGEESLTGAAAMLADHVLEHTRPQEIHALHCGPFPVGQFAVMPGFGLPGQDHATVTLTGPGAADRATGLAAAMNALGTVGLPASPAQMERLVADVQIPHGPYAEFVFMRAAAAGERVQVSYRCWPEARWTALRADIGRLAAAAGPATVEYPGDPFPAMVVPPADDEALARYLRRTNGRDRVVGLHAALPYNGEDFALFLRRLPGTYTFLGVRRPGASIETAFPHFGAFDPDERAIAHGVRAMAGWLAHRAVGDHGDHG
ncbi:M20/M25/M40 family metallo-hydrolase [Dactylosporangium sp. NPDC049140]|uniref:M20 metallopeptidase family protein n=1 Tax=Dactylosporangium sp. NPDC049140 TaxID=3155647 RepID=UPI0033F3E0F3